MKNCPVHCDNCNYPIFRYARCCPMCGRAVTPPAESFAEDTNIKAVPTRFDFWIASLRKSIGTTRLKRAA